MNDPWNDINPQNPAQKMGQKTKPRTSRPDQARAGNSTKHDYGTRASLPRNEDGLVITPTLEAMRKNLIPQRKQSNAELMSRLAGIREPIVQEEPGANG